MINCIITPEDETLKAIHVSAKSAHHAMLIAFPNKVNSPSERFKCLSIDDGCYNYIFSSPIGKVSVSLIYNGRKLGNNIEDCAIVKELLGK